MDSFLHISNTGGTVPLSSVPLPSYGSRLARHTNTKSFERKPASRRKFRCFWHSSNTLKAQHMLVWDGTTKLFWLQGFQDRSQLLCTITRDIVLELLNFCLGICLSDVRVMLSTDAPCKSPQLQSSHHFQLRWLLSITGVLMFPISRSQSSS